MWRKTKAVCISVFISLSMFYVLDISFEIIDNVSGTMIYVNITGSGGSFTSIQDAIDASIDGDTVFVYNGTYYENIIVNKMINLFGENRENTIIDGNGSGDVVYVSADWVNMTGFTVTGSGEGLGDSGIRLNNARNCRIYGNIFSHNKIRGIITVSSDNNTIYENNISYSQNGLSISSSDNNKIYNNNVSYCDYGISLHSALKNNVTDNTVSFNNESGIVVSGPCDWSEVDNNQVFENLIGLQLTSYGPSNISNNVIQNNQLGIYLRSKGTNITNNSMMGSGIFIDSEQISHWNTNEIDSLNTIDGKPVYYLKNQTGGSVPLGFGQIILANCSYVSIENQSFSNGSEGILIGFSSNLTIAHNNVSSQNNHGIMLQYSDDSVIFENEVHNNDLDGIHLENSMRNVIRNNNATQNSAGINLSESGPSTVVDNNVFYNTIGISLYVSNYIENYVNATGNNASHNQIGINLYGCYYALVTKNEVYSNTEYGFYVMYSQYNRIHYNNIIDNEDQAYDYDYKNYWDNGYPWGGNYWSDYAGNDSNKGPSQDQPGADGIGDEPYSIRKPYSDSYDNYPLMEPFVSEKQIKPVHNLDKDIYYEWIQEAIDDADPGNTILVGSARYHETISVNKSLALVGEDRPNTIIDGGLRGNAIEVVADWVNITGLTVTRVGSGKSGIRLEKVRNCSILNNNISGNVYHGIYLFNCSKVTVSDNNASDNYDGIYCDTSSFISIINNTVLSGTMYGIYVTDSDNLTIENNQAVIESDPGIYVIYSENIVITENYASQCRWGVHVKYSDSITITNNTLFDNFVGISLYTSDGKGLIHNNVLINNNYGIALSGRGNVISNNIIESSSLNGIDLGFSQGATVKNNTMTRCGIFIEGTNLEYWNTHDIDTSNTVNGKPVYYWKNQTGGVVPFGAGQVILANCINVLVENQNVSSGSVGILMGHSSGNTIANCTSNENNDDGIYLRYSNNNYFINNTVNSNAEEGAYIYNSDFNTLDSNTVCSNGYHGIYLRNSEESTIMNNNVSFNAEEGLFITGINNYIANNTISENLHGIFVTSEYNIFMDNNISYNIDHGIRLRSCESNTISGNNMIKNGIFISGNDVKYWNTHTINTLNTVNNKAVYYYKDQDIGTVPPGAGQVILANSDYWVINNQNCSFGSVGILLGYSNYNTIANSNVQGNIFGIYFFKSDNNIISNCTAYLNRNYGLYLNFAQENRIDNSTFHSNEYGIYLYASHESVIENSSIISNVNAGIYFSWTLEIILHNNTMVDCGIYIEGHGLGYFNSHTIDESNTVNDRPVYYWKNRVGGRIPSNAGQVILANCADIVIENLNTSSASCGIELAWSSDIIVTNNTASLNSLYGIYMFFADDNQLSNNTISDCDAGISFKDSMRNTLFNNSVINCKYGIQIYEQFASSENNLIYHNNFIENLYPERDNAGGKNFWNASYPIGGNYWSDYDGEDNLRGVKQDEPGSDGFGDTPYQQYLFYWIGLDYYPLMNPTRDAQPPRIELISPANNSVIQPGLVLDFGVYDENSYIVNYSIDNGVEESLEPPYDISTVGWSEGPHTILIEAEDFKGNTASLLFSFTIDSISPIIQLNSPSNNSAISKGAILNFSISDSNLQNVNYSLDGGPDNSFPDPFDLSTAGWIDKDYMIRINAIDLAGNTNSSWYTFTVDSSPPSISLNSPLNDSIIIEGEILDFSISDPHPVQVNYSINGGLENSFAVPYNISTSGWLDGDYVVQINALDSLGNQNSKWYSFSIDSTPPTLVFTNPGNNSVVAEGTLLNFSITDVNLDQANYSINSGNAMTFSQPYDLSTENWSDGEYSIQVSAIDLAGNSNSSRFFFTIDSTRPLIYLDSQQNNSVIPQTTLIEFSVEDPYLLSTNYSINGGDRINVSEQFNISMEGWADGDYIIQINALDMAGNLNSSWFFFTLDSTPPTITIDPALNHSTIPAGKAIKLNISDPDSVMYSKDGVEYSLLPSPYIIDTSNWSDGDYTITVKANDTIGNGAAIWFEVTVDALLPYVVSTNPLNQSIDLDINATIIITFNERMNQTNAETHISFSNAYELQWNTAGTELSLSFATSNLEEGTTYTLTIDSQITDINGNPMASDFILVFSTAPLDTDSDGIPDSEDDDDDNDGYLDEDDDFPLNATEWLDTDKDGIGNNADTDDDDDGHLDENDAYPLDSSLWKKTEEEPADANWVWYVILAVVAAAVIVLLILFRKRGTEESKIPMSEVDAVDEFEVDNQLSPMEEVAFMEFEGQEYSEEFECPVCGKDFEEIVSVCPECGAEFDGVEE